MIKAVIFDFDGTLSLIREGWQKIMKGYFFEELSKAPAKREDGRCESLRDGSRSPVSLWV